jgi:hypothetical protein
VTKEIIVKFIETGRVSPTNFAEIFPGIYQVVRETITTGPFPGKATQETERDFPDKGPDKGPNKGQDKRPDKGRDA